MFEKSITERLPDILPVRSIEITETQTFQVLDPDGSATPHTVYQPEKAPFTRLVDVSLGEEGNGQTYAIPDEVEPRDTDGDGTYEKIAFVGGDLPEDGTEFSITYVADSFLGRHARAHGQELDATSQTIESAIDSKSVETASGQALDLIGRQYGLLGLRRGRNDDVYRNYLKSLVNTFDGRGTQSGVKLAVGSALGLDDEVIELREDFQNTNYDLVISEWSPHATSMIADVADLADPSGVDLSRIVYQIDQDAVRTTDTVTVRFGPVITDAVVTDENVTTTTTPAGDGTWVDSDTASNITDNWGYNEWQ